MDSQRITTIIVWFLLAVVNAAIAGAVATLTIFRQFGDLRNMFFAVALGLAFFCIIGGMVYDLLDIMGEGNESKRRKSLDERMLILRQRTSMDSREAGAALALRDRKARPKRWDS